MSWNLEAMSIGNGSLIISTNIFSLHPLFMSFGFLFFMFNGIDVLSENIFGPLKSRSKKIKAHWILESLSVLFIFIGFIGIYANKILNGKPHFATWHGLIGAVASFSLVFMCSCSYPEHFQSFPAGNHEVLQMFQNKTT
ncbi:unnamed protein product [Schistosoma rodhaini]|uniref:ascorbate ferrireductase (transmembrane) n=1 Tax=Schistosoma rodhaini TaxID=6188 RepID=A0AA85GE84_9TREM|nr:unnamed protein product [Schistosoma rodhaini]